MVGAPSGAPKMMASPTADAVRGRDELLVYLDYDGALHHENVWWSPERGPFLKAAAHFTLFQHAKLLAEVLQPYPSALIVLSTTWVPRYGLEEALRPLPASLQERVIGATFERGMNKRAFAATSRGMQIWADVLRRQPRNWLALDDDDSDWPDWCRDRLIRTHEESGISEAGVLAELKAKLAFMCSEVER